MDLVDGLKAFVATAQTGSFTDAAERMGISNRLTSKYVAELEARIGARLLQRTTRKVGLTPVGEDLLLRAPALLDELDDLIGSVREESRGLSGLVRISAPVSFGEIYVGDMIRRFIGNHPQMNVDLRLNDAYVDLARDGIDLAFRIGTPSVSSLKMRKLGDMGSAIVASPDYISKHGEPREPHDLLDHICMVDANRRDPTRWVFVQGDKTIDVVVKRRFVVNSAKVARDWAVAGDAISYCPRFIVADDLAEGRLVQLLGNYQGLSTPLSAVYLDGTVLPRKVRAIIDFALDDIKTNSPF
ncbi:LysR family transcriptional regulator [uncultured Cohaesibacter sp.]|uniref:LysR family transcriptional regulator n=1 Tax=uncultured Cohaesibacter sp. TaxID=1002546 RepID=UPI0029C77F36|nr:LysR family transcriptional regulator [uncultured Cohaesibacter sp.]